MNLAPLQKLPNNVGDLGKIIAATSKILPNLVTLVAMHVMHIFGMSYTQQLATVSVIKLLRQYLKYLSSGVLHLIKFILF